MNKVSHAYPGAGSTVSQTLMLADEYYSAAMLLIRQEDPHGVTRFAPARLCVIQAIELYLNAFLLFEDVEPAEIRGFQHALVKRAEATRARGLVLKAKTYDRLAELEASREYLLVRYGPERSEELMALPQMFSVLDNVTKAVRRRVLQQPYAADDPRYKKIWMTNLGRPKA